MKRRLGIIFWIESILASLAALLAVITLAWRDWIEAVLGVDPDHHNGAAEWLVVASCSLAAVLLAALARHEWVSAPMKAAVGASAKT